MRLYRGRSIPYSHFVCLSVRHILNCIFLYIRYLNCFLYRRHLFRFVELRNYFDTCGVGSKQSHANGFFMSLCTTFSSTRKVGHRRRRRRRRHYFARRGTRHLHAAEPRRREGWEREGSHRGTCHLRAAEAKKGMLLRGDPDASPTPDKVQAQHINTCVPPQPVACPHPHALENMGVA